MKITFDYLRLKQIIATLLPFRKLANKLDLYLIFFLFELKNSDTYNSQWSPNGT